jgi:hypothetical protein
MTVLPLVKAAHAAGLSGTPPVGTGVFYPIPFESFSNYGWLGTFWLDFRDLGVLGLPFLVGALATALFRSYWRRPSIGWLWALSMLMLVIAFSPLANELSTTFTWEHLALAPVLGIALAAGRRAYAPTRRMVLAAAVLAMLGVAGLAAVRQSRGDPARPDAGSELIAAAVDAHVAFSTEGQYPSTKPLVSRLQVSNPAMDIRPLYTIDDPVPRAPAIGVLSNPYDVYFRTRTRDGRVLELHRIERFGGLTFGPGSRDG